MAKGNTVPFERCACGKRGWADIEDAEKALGRAKTKRARAADKAGSRRGMDRENRVYLCHAGDLYHLTGQSKRENNAQMLSIVPDATSDAWERFLAEQGSILADAA